MFLGGSGRLEIKVPNGGVCDYTPVKGIYNNAKIFVFKKICKQLTTWSVGMEGKLTIMVDWDPLDNGMPVDGGPAEVSP